MRILQYLPWLESANVDVTVSSLFSEAYVSNLQRGARSRLDVGLAYAGRLRSLLGRRRADLVWIENELFPWLPSGIERVLLSSKAPFLLDYDDAVFHRYDLHQNSVVKRLLAGKHPSIMRRAALVVAGNEYLAEYALRAGADHVEILPTVVDLDRYPQRAQERSAGDARAPRIGWIGQRSTAGNLRPYKDLFARIESDGHGSFVAIGIDARSLGLPMESIPWTEETEVASIARLDIGIMPLLDEPFERGKCGYKLIQYMACGLPVVASPVGVNRQIVEHGVNGFLAETTQEWETALRALLAEPAMRRRMGQAGRQKVEQLYSLQVTAPKLVGLLKAAASR